MTLAHARHGILAILLVPALFGGQRFYDDDPLDQVPAPMPVTDIEERRMNTMLDFFQGSFATPGDIPRKKGAVPPPAGGVNTLGETIDPSWNVNRHWPQRMSIEELARGPDRAGPPSMDGPWEVLKAKAEGVTLGFHIRDSKGRRYVVKFDPLSNIDLASAADTIGAKFFHALGYHVPENYVVYFERDQVQVGSESKTSGDGNKSRRLKKSDIDKMFKRIPYEKGKGCRAVASLYLSGPPLGSFRMWGTRSDDPNDLVPHEHRRELRGLFVFAAWLGHNDIKSLNSLDTLVEDENGVPHVRHNLIDFGASLGSSSFAPREPYQGYEHIIDTKLMVKQAVTFGFYLPRWTRSNFHPTRQGGRFDYEAFDPEQWKSNYPIPAFLNRLPDDEFWAAKRVMQFTDEEIRAIVHTGDFSDEDAEEWLVKCLIERRDRIGRTFFAKVLPLDNFRIESGRLAFDDLGVRHGVNGEQDYDVSWFAFDNQAEQRTPLNGSGVEIPASSSEYVGAEIKANDPAKCVTVYLRRQGDNYRVVGLDQSW